MNKLSLLPSDSLFCDFLQFLLEEKEQKQKEGAHKICFEISS